MAAYTLGYGRLQNICAFFYVIEIAWFSNIHFSIEYSGICDGPRGLSTVLQISSRQPQRCNLPAQECQLEKLIQSNWKACHSLTRGVVNGVCDGTRDSCYSYFPDTTRAHRSQWVRNIGVDNVDGRHIRLDGQVILRPSVGFMMRPVRSSNNVSSVSAMPIPMMMPPRNWERAVLGFRILPASKAPSQRLKRSSPVCSCTRTSQNCAA